MNRIDKTIIRLAYVILALGVGIILAAVLSMLTGCADSHCALPPADAEVPLCFDTCVLVFDEVCVQPGPPDCGGPGCVVACDVELNADGSCDVPYWDCGEDRH